jgi:hypothetical protein
VVRLGRVFPSFALLAGALPVVLAACILDADGFSGGVPPGADSGPAPPGEGGSGGPDSTGSTNPDAGNGGLDGGSEAGGIANILVNGDFELGCAGWSAGFGSIVEASVAHSGTRSCKFCMGTNYRASLTRQGPTNAVVGKTYYAEVWMQGAETVTQLETWGYNGSSVNLYIGNDEGEETPGPKSAADWVRATGLFVMPRDGSAVGISLNFYQDGNPAAVGDRICLYVDDAVVRPLD